MIGKAVRRHPIIGASLVIRRLSSLLMSAPRDSRPEETFKGQITRFDFSGWGPLASGADADADGTGQDLGGFPSSAGEPKGQQEIRAFRDAIRVVFLIIYNIASPPGFSAQAQNRELKPLLVGYYYCALGPTSGKQRPSLKSDPLAWTRLEKQSLGSGDVIHSRF